LRRFARAFPGVGIDCESVLVDGNNRRLERPFVPTRAIDVWHCVALWACNHHSYIVRVENEAEKPLYYVDSEQRQSIAAEFRVEPPLKRRRGEVRPTEGRNARSFRISAEPQNPAGGRVARAELRSTMRALRYFETETSNCILLPDEPAYRGFARARCSVD
jgi:hypothetical protein